jgi:hypothetical protein
MLITNNKMNSIAYDPYPGLLILEGPIFIHCLIINSMIRCIFKFMNTISQGLTIWGLSLVTLNTTFMVLRPWIITEL